MISFRNVESYDYEQAQKLAAAEKQEEIEPKNGI